jgi:hypothetical protein
MRAFRLSFVVVVVVGEMCDDVVVGEVLFVLLNNSSLSEQFRKFEKVAWVGLSAYQYGISIV